MTNRITRALASLGLIGTLAGCATQQVRAPIAQPSIDERLVLKANELVSELKKYKANSLMEAVSNEVPEASNLGFYDAKIDGYKVTLVGFSPKFGEGREYELSITTPDGDRIVDYSGSEDGKEYKLGCLDWPMAYGLGDGLEGANKGSYGHPDTITKGTINLQLENGEIVKINVEASHFPIVREQLFVNIFYEKQLDALLAKLKDPRNAARIRTTEQEFAPIYADYLQLPRK